MNAVLLYPEIPKGMKSYGPKAIIPVTNNDGSTTPLIIKQIKELKKTCNKIYIVLGFDKEKIIDVINDYKIENIEYIDYNDYQSYNDGGSLKTVFQKIDPNNNYLIIQGGVIVPRIAEPKYNTLYCLNKQSLSNENNFSIGIRTNDSCMASYLFYDVMSLMWTEITYITWSSIIGISELIKINKIYSGMFLFECINTAIEHGIDFQIKEIKNNINKINHYKQ